MYIEELGNSKGWFRALIEQSTDAILLLARDSTITYASPSTEQIIGSTVEEVMGKQAHTLVHPEDWEQVTQ